MTVEPCPPENRFPDKDLLLPENWQIIVHSSEIAAALSQLLAHGSLGVAAWDLINCSKVGHVLVRFCCHVQN